MGIGLGIFSGATMLADYAPRAANVEITSNSHGPEKLSCDVPLGLWESFSWLDPNGLPTMQAMWNGLTLFKGRLEDKRIRDGGVAFQALGPWRSLSDLPYTALWSRTNVNDFRPMLASEVNTSFPDRFSFNTTNRIYIAPQKNATLGTTGSAKFGALCVLSPSGQSRGIVGIQFDYTLVSPAANWRLLCRSRDAAFAGLANVLIVASAGAGTITGSLCTTITSAQIIDFAMDFNAADAAFAGETGSAYVEIKNLRLTSSTANVIATTLTIARTNGSPVTCTVGSTVRMYVGQRIFLSGGGNSESVIVISVPSGTTFTANVINAPGGGYPIGTTVRAHVIYADEIAADMVGDVAATNSSQLSGSTALIASPGLDLTDEVYQDASMATVLDTLAGYGDAAGNAWEVGVTNDLLLYFRIQGGAGRTWYVDASDIDVDRTIQALSNSIYAVYQDASGVPQRSSASTDAASVSRYGLTREQALNVSSTSATQAAAQVAAALADGKDPAPRAGVTFTAIYDASGARRLLFEPQGGDTIVIRNLPPSLATTIDQIRIFRIAHTSYRADDDTLTVEPDIPRPTLEFLLGRLALATGRTRIGG
jgi:hypothetical protein